jgi:hypothetical protein
MTDYQQTKYYFADHNDANKIYPELGPINIPGVDEEWVAANHKCLGGEDAYGNYVAGNVRTFVGGTGVGAQTLQLDFTWMSIAKLDLLFTLKNTMEQFIFSDGTTRWLCVWEGGRPIEPKGITGSKTGFAVTVTMRIQGVYT